MTSAKTLRLRFLVYAQDLCQTSAHHAWKVRFI